MLCAVYSVDGEMARWWMRVLLRTYSCNLLLRSHGTLFRALSSQFLRLPGTMSLGT